MSTVDCPPTQCPMTVLWATCRQLPSDGKCACLLFVCSEEIATRFAGLATIESTAVHRFWGRIAVDSKADIENLVDTAWNRYRIDESFFHERFCFAITPNRMQLFNK